MHSTAKKVLIGIGILGGLILSVFIGIFIYAESDSGQQWIRNRINRAIPGEILWQDLQFSPFGGRIEVTRALVSGPSGEKILSVDRLFLNFSWTALAGGALSIEKAELNRPRLWLASDESGDLNLIRAFGEPGPDTEPPQETTETGFPANVKIDQLRLTDGFFEYRTRPRSPDVKTDRIALDDIEFTLENGNLSEKTGRIVLTIEGGEVDMGDIRTRLDRLHVDTALRDGRLTPLALDLRTDGPTLKASGNVDHFFTDPEMDVRIDLDLDLADLRRMLRMDATLSGPLQLTLSASGSPKDPRAALAITYGGGELAGIEVQRLEFTSRLEDRVVTIERMDLDSVLGKVSASGAVDLRKAFPGGLLSEPADIEAVTYRLTLEGTDTALQRLPWTADILSGNIRTRIDLEGSGLSHKTLTAGANLDVSSEDFAIQDILDPVPVDLKGRATFAGGTITLAPLDLNTRETLIRLNGDYDIFANALEMNLRVETPDLARFLTPLQVPDLSGKATLVADLSGPVEQPAVEIDLQSENVRFQDIAFGDVSLDAVLQTSGLVDIARLEMNNRGSHLAIHGTLRLFDNGFAHYNPDLPADLELVFRDLEVTDFIETVDFNGSLAGNLDLKGGLSAPSADLSLRGKALAWGDTRIGDLEAGLRLADGTLTIRRMALKNRQSAIEASGTAKILNPENLQLLDNPAFDIDIAEGTLHLSDFMDTLQGKLTIDGRAEGTLKGPAARLTVRGEGLAARGNAIGNLEANLQFAEGRLRLTPLKLENGESNIEINGTARLLDPVTLALLDDPEFDLQVADSTLYLQDFTPDMTGRLALDGKLGGSLRHPTGTVTLEGGRLDLGFQELDGVHLESRLDGERFHIEPLLIAMAPGEDIRTDGWISLGKRYDLRTRSEGISLNQLEPFEDRDFGNGKIAFDLAGKGSLEKPELDGEIDVFGIRIQNRDLQDLKLEMEIRNQVARITGNLDFDLNAQYHLESKAFSLTARFDDTDLTPYFRLAGREELTGNITGTIEAEGNAEAPDRIRASTDISRMTISTEGTELVRTQGFQASFENGRITLPENRLILLKDGYLALRGGGNLDGALSVEAEGSIPVRVAEAFVPDLTGLTGNIDLSAHVKGSLETPDIEADITLRQVGMTVPELMQKLHGLNGRIRVTPAAVRLENIEGQLDDGRFNIAGRIDLADFRPARAEIDFTAQALPVEVPDVLNLLLNTTLKLEGTPDKSRLSGEVVLLDGLYYKDVKLNLLQKIGEIGERKRQTSVPQETEPVDAPFLKNLLLDIAVRYRSPLMVDNNVALVSLKPELRIQGSLNQPLVNGRAEISEGNIFYQNTEFEVEKGVVDFVNPYKIEPTIDVAAISEVRKWTIRLNIFGTPENLKFKLSSEPAEEDADILSLLAIGKTTRELVKGEGGGSKSPKELLAGIVSDRLQGDIKKSTGLDIEFDYKEGEGGNGENEDEDEGEIRVTVGKELSRRITVKYGVERRGGETVQKATTEYKVLENFLMSAFQDTEGDFGGELQFRLEFR